MGDAILADRYHIIRHLGSGGFGQTYVAEDRQLPGNPLCVVKQLKPQARDRVSLDMARRFFNQEAEVLYRLGTHAQIPELLAHFEENQEFYLVQELIEGDNLSHQILPGKSLEETEVIILLQEILKILEFVHGERVIHRDVKPENLIRRQQDKRLFLIDFGAVKQITTQNVQANQQSSYTIMIGSVGYMPVEQLSGKPRFSSDIYAVGMIGIQAVTGIIPGQFDEDPETNELSWRDHARISPAFGNVLETMVRYDFRERYQSATEALQALQTLGKRSLSRPKLATTAPTKTPPSTVKSMTPPSMQRVVTARESDLVDYLAKPSSSDSMEPFSTGFKIALIGIGVATIAMVTALNGTLNLILQQSESRQASPKSTSLATKPSSTASPAPTLTPAVVTAPAPSVEPSPTLTPVASPSPSVSPTSPVSPTPAVVEGKSSLTANTPQELIAELDRFQASLDESMRMARSREEWELVAVQLENMVGVLKAVPESSSGYKLAQRSLRLYEQRLTYARRQATRPVGGVAR